MSTYIPEDKRDTSYYIFHRLFMCRVKNIDTMSVDFIKMFGMPCSGDEQEDKATANELVIRMLSINQMLEYYQKGVTVHVVNYKDTKEIYERISDHLNAWKFKLNNDFHVRDAPVEDLLALDQFANVVYKHAVSQFTTKEADSIISRRVSGIMRADRLTLMKPLANKNAEGVKEEVKYPERVSMAESFAQPTLPAHNLNKSWR